MNVVSSRRVIYFGVALVSGVVASAKAEKVLLDFGDNSSYRGISVSPNPDANGNTWNEIHTGAYFQNLLDTTGTPTTLATGFSTPVGTDSYNGPAGATDNFGGPANDLNNFTLDPALGDLDNNAAAIDYVNSAGGPCQFVLNGLNSTETYTLIFYGSQQYSTDANTVYSVFSDVGYTNQLGSATLNVGSGNNPNLSQVATISGLTPNAGSLFVEFLGQQGDTGFLNSMEIIGNVVVSQPTWAINGSGDWNTAGNWGGTIPNGIDAKANLLGAITTSQTVNTDVPITVGTMVFNNSAASYAITGAVGASLTLQVSTGNALIDVQAGTHEINLPLILASNTTFQTDASTAKLIIADPITINSGLALTTVGTGTVTYQSTITLLSNATMNITSSTYAHALSLASGATVNLNATTAGSKTVLQLDSLSNSGTLNTNNNDVIIHGGTTLATVTSQIASGYTNGTWSGTGITSASAAGDTNHLHALGVAPVSAAGTFDGAAVAAGDVEVKYTYYGDANLDGTVTAADYLQIDSGFNSQGGASPLTGWFNGDFNYDGKINGDDYTLIDNAFNAGGAQILSVTANSTAQIAGTSAVPEPTTIGLLGIAAAGMLARRQRRN